MTTYELMNECKKLSQNAVYSKALPNGLWRAWVKGSSVRSGQWPTLAGAYADLLDMLQKAHHANTN